MTIPDAAVELIITQEGLDQPSKWPGGNSGITIGIGYDLGQERSFGADWAGVLPPAQITELSTALGKTGQAAHAIAVNFRNISISMAQALQVFTGKTLPHYIDETLKAFPGADKLPAIILGALVSLVYNRGSSMTGPRRIEMRIIRATVSSFAEGLISLAACVAGIASQFRSMKRLWIGTDIEHDMTQRREAEAKLVESALQPSPA